MRYSGGDSTATGGEGYRIEHRADYSATMDANIPTGNKSDLLPDLVPPGDSIGLD